MAHYLETAFSPVIINVLSASLISKKIDSKSLLKFGPGFKPWPHTSRVSDTTAILGGYLLLIKRKLYAIYISLEICIIFWRKSVFRCDFFFFKKPTVYNYWHLKYVQTFQTYLDATTLPGKKHNCVMIFLFNTAETDYAGKIFQLISRNHICVDKIHFKGVRHIPWEMHT